MTLSWRPDCSTAARRIRNNPKNKKRGGCSPLFLSVVWDKAFAIAAASSFCGGKEQSVFQAGGCGPAHECRFHPLNNADTSRRTDGIPVRRAPEKDGSAARQADRTAETSVAMQSASARQSGAEAIWRSGRRSIRPARRFWCGWYSPAAP